MSHRGVREEFDAAVSGGGALSATRWSPAGRRLRPAHAWICTARGMCPTDGRCRAGDVHDRFIGSGKTGAMDIWDVAALAAVARIALGALALVAVAVWVSHRRRGRGRPGERT